MNAIETSRQLGLVSKIAFAPVKSGSMIEVNEATLTRNGIDGDREFMIVREGTEQNGVHKFVTQRQYPILALLRPIVRDGLQLTWKGQNQIDVPNDAVSGKEILVDVWGDISTAVDQGEKVADWLSDHLHTRLRLVKATESFKRMSRQNYLANTNEIRFQDGYPIHWVMQESINELSHKAGVTLSSKNFRQNLVVEGGTPQLEHLVYEWEVAGIRLIDPKPCTRCMITNINPETGEHQPQSFRVLNTLATYKWWQSKEGPSLIFGENALPLATGKIKIGDTVAMVSVRNPPLRYGARA